jgi:hypothetical protein
MKYKKEIGSRYEVFKGIAKKTGGGLQKKNLKLNNNGKIISKKLSKIMKLRYKKSKTKKSGGFINNISSLFQDKKINNTNKINYIKASKSKYFYKNNIKKGGMNNNSQSNRSNRSNLSNTSNTSNLSNQSNQTNQSNPSNQSNILNINRYNFEKKNGSIIIKNKSKKLQKNKTPQVIYELTESIFNIYD